MSTPSFAEPGWFDEVTAKLAGCPHDGAAGTIEITVTGGPAGAIRYAIVLKPGDPPRYEPGARADADSSYEQSWDDALAQQHGGFDPAVAYMQGQLKVKGATRPLFELFRFWARPDVRSALTDPNP